jgi:methylmalonyl-CoA/ethylmalonyl-CoA epimerase
MQLSSKSPEFRFHHLGILVPDIRDFLQSTNVGPQIWPWVTETAESSKILHESSFQVQILLLPLGADSWIELIQPDSRTSPLFKILENRRAAWHHVAFEVEDLDKALARTEISRMITIVPPTPAKAFQQRRVAFVLGQDQLLWELLESGNAHTEQIK